MLEKITRRTAMKMEDQRWTKKISVILKLSV